MPKSQQLLTTRQFAEKAGVSSATVSGWIRSGKIKGRKDGNKWLIAEGELKNTQSEKASHSTPKVPAQKKNAPPSKKDAKAAKLKPASKPDKTKATEKIAKSSPSGKSFSVDEFSEMTYLTVYGVKQWLKEGRIAGAADASGQMRIDASNLENALVKRLVR